MGKYAITGSAGLVGSHLTDALIKRGDIVYGIDNFETGLKSSVSPQSVFIEGTIASKIAMEYFFDGLSGIDAIVHCAASYKNPHNWTGDIDTNVTGTIFLLRLAEMYKIPRIIYLQTSLCYGHPQSSPITLGHQINPGNSYAISKYACEQYIKLSGIDHVIFRLSNIYGPRGLAGPVPTFYKRLSEGKDCFVVNTRREYIYIDDMIKYLIAALDGTGRGIYHISTGKDISIGHLYDTICCDLFDAFIPPKKVERLDDDVESILLDPSRTVKDFGFLPSIQLDEGIHNTMKYYKEYGVGETFTHLKMET